MAGKSRKNRISVGELIAADKTKKVLEVLDKHGITFCAGCFLTLTAAPEKAAVYHAVPDKKKFLLDLGKVLR